MDPNTGKLLYAFLLTIVFLDTYALVFSQPWTASFYMAVWVMMFSISVIVVLALRLRSAKRGLH